MTQRSLSIPEPEMRVLNDSVGSEVSCSNDGVETSTRLQRLMLRMKGECMSEGGHSVDYDRLKTSALWTEYVAQAAALRHTDLSALSQTQKMAFFINVYNALTLHGLVSLTTLPSSVLDVQLFWKTTAYVIDGNVYSLDDVEHGVLRGNRPHPSSKTPPFSADDPRLKHAMKTLDPRIHFALVCGAKSCPAINVYTADNLERALQGAARSFCEQEISVYLIQKQVKMSRIFQWYRMDFGGNDVEAIRWALPYLDEKKQKDLKKLLYQLEEKGMVDICYKEYNWSLNKT